MDGKGRHRAATGNPLPLLLLVLCILPGHVAAQAVPRTDTPGAGKFWVTFAPVITTWEREFTESGHEQRIGASLPAVVRVREEERVTPLAVDFGITNRLAIGVYLPIVRVNTHATYPLDSLGRPAPDSAAQALDSLLADTTYAFEPIDNTSRRERFFGGDIEVHAKYRLLETTNYALSATALVRLPTGHQDSPNNLFDLSTGDHQTDLELQVAQELTLFHRLWLNGMIRLGVQRPGIRTRRIGPQSALLLPHAATATLAWDPGDYAGIDLAPMLRFSTSFAVGVTVSYWTQQPDRYTYRTAQDSIDMASRFGVPITTSPLDFGTGIRRTRVGFAMTYLGAAYEGSFSVEQTVSGTGVSVPVATVFRIVMRTSRWPF
jgi:hypothetical protein